MFKEQINKLELNKKDSEESVFKDGVEDKITGLNNTPEQIESGAHSSPIETDNQKLTEEGLETFKAKIAERFFLKAGLIEKSELGTSFDLEAIKNMKTRPLQNALRFVYDGKQKILNYSDILKFLTNQSGFIKDDPEKKDKPFFSLPLSLDDAKNGKFSDGHCFPWDFQASLWENVMELQDGEKVSLPDLFYLQKMKELGFYRDKNGELFYHDEETGEQKKFVSRNAVKIFGRSVTLKNSDGAPYALHNCPGLFINKHLPLINSLSIFRENDFKRMSTTKSFDRFLSHDRKFNIGGGSFYNSAVNEVDIKYYLGRKNIIGTDKKIEDNMFLRDLSTDTVGVIQDEHERKKILYTFDKVGKSELTEMGAFQVDKDYFTINGAEMAQRIKKYQISDFLPRRKDESPEAYANRLADLNDVDFVTEKFRDVIGQAQVPVSQFSWPEQLMIANYAMSGTKAGKLIEFANRYGVDGLKAFLTVERDANIGQLIFDIGSKLESNKAKLIFSKVSELGVLANKEKEELTEILLNNKDTSLVEGVHSKLIDVATGALREFQGVGNKKNKELKNIDNLMAKLQAIKTDNALLISVLKSAKEEGQAMTLEMIKNLDLEKKIINSQEESLSQEEKSELLRIAQENYSTIFLQTGPNYNPEAYQRIIDHFSKELDNLNGQTVYILKYKNEIIGFNRFKPLSPYEVYAGSFNISKDIQGLSIGKSFLAKTLDDVSASYDIHAQTRQDNPANNSYLRQGFIITGEYQEPDGVAYYNLIKPSRASSEKVA